MPDDDAMVTVQLAVPDDESREKAKSAIAALRDLGMPVHEIGGKYLFPVYDLVTLAPTPNEVFYLRFPKTKEA